MESPKEKSIRAALRNSLLLALADVDKPEADTRTIASRIRQQAGLAVIQLDEMRDVQSLETVLKGNQ